MTRSPDVWRLGRFHSPWDPAAPPRYVYTYPYKGAYRAFSDSRAVTASWALGRGLLNLYVHIPFCNMKCAFCHLFTTARHSEDTRTRYVTSLLNEARLVAQAVELNHYEVDSVYFGGGTPTLLPFEQLTRLVYGLRDIFPFRDCTYMAIESAPNTVNVPMLRALRAMGFQRISMGIQSFESRELREMGRPYESDVCHRMLSAALDALPNVNLDLIYGLPGQTPQTWLQSLHEAASTGVPTITIYPLTIRARTRFGQQLQKGPSTFLGTESIYALYDIAVQFLQSLGYRQQTFASFAKQGGGNRHEENEFSGIPTIGLGTAALSYAPYLHYTSGDYLTHDTAEGIADYVKQIDAGKIPVRSAIVLDDDETRRRCVILGLLYQGIARDEFRIRFNEDIENRFGAKLNELRQEGCLDEGPTRIMLSARGRRFSSLIADLLASERVKWLAESYR